MSAVCLPPNVMASFLLLAMIPYALPYAIAADQQTVTPLPQAHAHNDYEHPRPLHDALDHGFLNVEADIFLVEGQLLVGHTRSDLHPERTLERLYLEPLRERIVRLGKVYPHCELPFTLLVDIKSEGATTYRKLAPVLAQYADMLASVNDGVFRPGPIQVVVSGNRAHEVILGEKVRHVGIDGRFDDLASPLPDHALPWISDRWGAHFRWMGDGPFPEEERRQLRTWVERAHQKGRRVRFWATPEAPAVWDELLAADVDLVGTDKLAELQQYLQHRSR